MIDYEDETGAATDRGRTTPTERAREAGAVPAVGHFIWLGPTLPWFALMAIRSARLRGGFDRIVLHHEPGLGACTSVDELRARDDIELRVLDETVLFEKLQSEGVPALGAVYERLVNPADRADLLRLAILALEGGVYIDVDTLTVRDFGALRQASSAFLGTEHILHPGPEAAVAPPGPVRGVALQLLRTTLSRVGFGWRTAIRLRHLYPEVANNAIIGATPGHPFILGLLARIAAMPPDKQQVRFALGPHLLQAALADGADHGVSVLPPTVLFPLGPVVSQHWFRMRRRMPPLSALVRSDTVAIHWYASSKKLSRLLPRYSDAYIRACESRQLYSRIACGVLDGKIDAELDG